MRFSVPISTAPRLSTLADRVQRGRVYHSGRARPVNVPRTPDGDGRFGQSGQGRTSPPGLSPTHHQVAPSHSICLHFPPRRLLLLVCRGECSLRALMLCVATPPSPAQTDRRLVTLSPARLRSTTTTTKLSIMELLQSQNSVCAPLWFLNSPVCSGCETRTAQPHTLFFASSDVSSGRYFLLFVFSLAQFLDIFAASSVSESREGDGVFGLFVRGRN